MKLIYASVALLAIASVTEAENEKRQGMRKLAALFKAQKDQKDRKSIRLNKGRGNRRPGNRRAAAKKENQVNPPNLKLQEAREKLTWLQNKKINDFEAFMNKQFELNMAPKKLRLIGEKMIEFKIRHLSGEKVDNGPDGDTDLKEIIAMKYDYLKEHPRWAHLIGQLKDKWQTMNSGPNINRRTIGNIAWFPKKEYLEHLRELDRDPKASHRLEDEGHESKYRPPTSVFDTTKAEINEKEFLDNLQDDTGKVFAKLESFPAAAHNPFARSGLGLNSAAASSDSSSSLESIVDDEANKVMEQTYGEKRVVPLSKLELQAIANIKLSLHGHPVMKQRIKRYMALKSNLADDMKLNKHFYGGLGSAYMREWDLLQDWHNRAATAKLVHDAEMYFSGDGSGLAGKDADEKAWEGIDLNLLNVKGIFG